MKRLVIWDFDGTLGDTFPAIAHCVKGTLRSQGLSYPGDESVRSVIGLSLPEMFERMSGCDSEAAHLLAKIYREMYATDGAEFITIFPGIADVLQTLTGHGIVHSIATSKSRRGVEASLAHLNIYSYFSETVSDDDVLNKKPHPEMVLRLLEHLQIPASDAIVVGDTVFDLEMGQRAEVDTIGVTWGNHGLEKLKAARPTYVVSHPSEIQNAVLAKTA